MSMSYPLILKMPGVGHHCDRAGPVPEGRHDERPRATLSYCSRLSALEHLSPESVVCLKNACQWSIGSSASHWTRSDHFGSMQVVHDTKLLVEPFSAILIRTFLKLPFQAQTYTLARLEAVSELRETTHSSSIFRLSSYFWLPEVRLLLPYLRQAEHFARMNSSLPPYTILIDFFSALSSSWLSQKSPP